MLKTFISWNIYKMYFILDIHGKLSERNKQYLKPILDLKVNLTKYFHNVT